jgi:biotin carboxylase
VDVPGTDAQARPVVADVQHRGAVAGLRALGRAGLRPVALGPDLSAAGLWSRYATASAVVQEAPGDLRGALRELVRRHGDVVVYPGTEATLDAVLDAAVVVPGVRAPVPAGPTRLLRDKAGLGELARGTGLGAATTLVEGTAAELRGVRVPLPCAVKPARPGGALGTTRVLETREAWDALLRVLPADEPLLVQPRLRGPVLSLDLVVDRDGAVVARCQHQGTRTWPAAAGSTVTAETVAPDEALVAAAGRLLARAGFWGLVDMEFLHGPDGPVLIDLNPRFFGCLALPLAAGVNLPEAWHRVVLGEPVGPPGPYRTGITYRWLEADVVAALKGDPRRLAPAALAGTGAMWAPDDPLPGPLLALNAVSRRIGARLPGVEQRLRALTERRRVVVGEDFLARDARFTREAPAPGAGAGAQLDRVA